MHAIETWFDGYRFRSRTEARWAVFFKAAGVKFQYEPQGYVLGGKKYLPDFYLPELTIWFEVKGEQPATAEEEICRALAIQSKKRAFLAIDEPSPDGWFIIFEPATGMRTTDRAGVLDYLIGAEEAKRGFAAARSARFEHGESGSKPTPSPRRGKNPYTP